MDNCPLRHPIKVAGIGMHWTDEYAKKYSAKLEEMGFYTKEIDGKDGSAWVVYSHRPFKRAEVDAMLAELFPDIKIDWKPSL